MISATAAAWARRYVTGLAAGLAMALCCGATGAAAQAALVSEGRAVQAGAARYVLHSQAVGRDFLVEVTWPPTEILPGQKLPAVYAVDGGYGLLGASATLAMVGGKMEPAFIVQVGYTNPIASNFGPRNTDLVHTRRTPVPGGPSFGGGGGKFETFMVEELRPFLAARYPIDPDRSVLVGLSGGGTFAANVLLNRPRAFSAYAIGGLTLAQDPTLLERARALAPKGEGRRVFVFYTPQDLAAGLRSDEFAAALAQPGSTLKVESRNLTSLNHITSYLAVAPEALPFLLPPKPASAPVKISGASVEPKVLERYVGTWRLEPGLTVIIRQGNEGLNGQVNGVGSPVPLLAKDERSFFARGVDTSIAFEKGARPKHATFRLRGMNFQAVRTGPAPPLGEVVN